MFLSKKTPPLSKYCLTYNNLSDNLYNIRAWKKLFLFPPMGSYTVWCAARYYLFRKGWSTMSSPVQFCAWQFHCWVQSAYKYCPDHLGIHGSKQVELLLMSSLKMCWDKQNVDHLCWRWCLLESFLWHKYFHELTPDATVMQEDWDRFKCLRLKDVARCFLSLNHCSWQSVYRGN